MDASADAVPGRLVSWSAEAAANPAEKRSAAPISWGSRVGFHRVGRYPFPADDSRFRPGPEYVPDPQREPRRRWRR